MRNEFKKELKKIKSSKKIIDLLEFGFEMGLRFKLDHSEWLEGVFHRYIKSNHPKYYDLNANNVLELDRVKSELSNSVKNKYIKLSKKNYRSKESVGEGDMLYLKPNDQLKYKTICRNLNEKRILKLKNKHLLKNKYSLEIKIMENKKRGKLYEAVFNSPSK